MYLCTHLHIYVYNQWHNDVNVLRLQSIRTLRSKAEFTLMTILNGYMYVVDILILYVLAHTHTHREKKAVCVRSVSCLVIIKTDKVNI